MFKILGCVHGLGPQYFADAKALNFCLNFTCLRYSGVHGLGPHYFADAKALNVLYFAISMYVSLSL